MSFSPQPPEAEITSFGELSARDFPVRVGVAKFDLAVTARDRGDVVELDFEYVAALFDEASVAQLTDHYQREPEALAVADGAQSLSYRELSARAAAFAELLVDRGLGRGDVVALLLPRSVDAVVAMLGMLGAGAPT